MATAQAEIIIRSEGQLPVRHVLGPGDYVIGRDETACHIRVSGDAVSRKLARLVVGELSALKEMPLVQLDLSGCTLIKDLGSLASCRRT